MRINYKLNGQFSSEKHSIFDALQGVNIEGMSDKPATISAEAQGVKAIGGRIGGFGVESLFKEMYGKDTPTNWEEFFTNCLMEFHYSGVTEGSKDSLEKIKNFCMELGISLNNAFNFEGSKILPFEEVVDESIILEGKFAIKQLYKLVEKSIGNHNSFSNSTIMDIERLNEYLIYLGDFIVMVSLNRSIASGKLNEEEIKDLTKMTGSTALAAVTTANITGRTRPQYNAHMNLAELNYSEYTRLVETPLSFGIIKSESGDYTQFNSKLNTKFTLSGKTYYLCASLVSEKGFGGDDDHTFYTLLEVTNEGLTPVTAFNKDVMNTLYEGYSYKDYSSKTKEIIGGVTISSPTFFTLPSTLHIEEGFVNVSTSNLVDVNKVYDENTKSSLRGRSYSNKKVVSVDGLMESHFFDSDHSELKLTKPKSPEWENLKHTCRLCDIPLYVGDINISKPKRLIPLDAPVNEMNEALRLMEKGRELHQSTSEPKSDYEGTGMKSISEDFRTKD